MKTKNETGRIATTQSTAEDTQRGNSASSSRRHLFHRSSVLGSYTTSLDIGFLSCEKDTRKESRSTPYIVVHHQASRRSSVSFFGAERAKRKQLYVPLVASERCALGGSRKEGEKRPRRVHGSFLTESFPVSPAFGRHERHEATRSLN